MCSDMPERDAEMLGVPVWRETTRIDVDREVSEFTEWMVDGAEPGRWHAEPVAVAIVEVAEAAKEWHIASHEVNPARMSPDRIVIARRRLMRAIDNLDAALGGGQNG